jgi:precorrin-6Y C5,15-methyltransferase (decarboxylating)
LLTEAEVLFGSESALRLVPDLTARRVVMGTNLPEVVEQLRALQGHARVAIIAIGDPLFYGTAKYLTDKIGTDAFAVVPHVSSMQLAFARLMQSWEDAYLSDLSSKPFETILDRIRTADTVGLFTTEQYPPNRIARELLARGINYFRGAVCENLGGRDERVTVAELVELQDLRFDPLNVMILNRKQNSADQPKRRPRLQRFGNPDDAFAQSRPKTGLITQAEVRAVALAQLDLRNGDVVWDVGAGSGSVAIEMAQLVEPGLVYAIEQDAADFHLIQANIETYSIANVKPIFGRAPDVFESLPAADAIFVGGNGGEVARLLEASYAALRPGGRLVANVGTLEMITATYNVLKRVAPQVDVLLMNLSRGVEQLESLRFEAVNPTVLLRVRKPTGEGDSHA